MDDDKKLKNVQILDNKAIMRINTSIYPLEVIQRAAYIMMDSAFILLDGEPDKYVDVELISKKDDFNLITLVQQFNDELLNYAVYKLQSEKNDVLRTIILEKVLLSNRVVLKETVNNCSNNKNNVKDKDCIMSDENSSTN